MNTIPSSIEINTFKGETVTQISFGLNVIIIFFSPTKFIQFSGGFTFTIDGKKEIFSEVFPVENDFKLLKLLEKRATDIYTNQQRTILSISFENGYLLELINNEQYESFTIYHDGHKTIV